MAYGKFKMVRGGGGGRVTVDPREKDGFFKEPRRGRGRVYTGGTPNFDERTGEYVSVKKPSKGRLKPVSPKPSPRKGINPPPRKGISKGFR